jgi:hypothetical protein
MLRASLTTLAAVLAVVTSAAEDGGAVVAAVKAYYPDATWQEKSVLTGDFTCQGKQNLAILGTSEKVIVIAVFANGLGTKPEFLEYSAKVRVAKWAVLSKETRDYKPGELEGEIGYLPDGFTPSKTCSGLNLTDENTDSAHIYWDAKSKHFRDWVL